MNTSYIAGLIDGEGYFGILPNYSKNLKGKSFSPVLKIGMTESSAKYIMEELQLRYGGRVEYRSRVKQGYRPVWYYIAKSNRRVKLIIDDILPDLIVKKPQAELILKFIALPYTHTLKVGYDPTIMETKQEMYEELKRLKAPESLATTK